MTSMKIELPPCFEDMSQYDVFNRLIRTVKNDPRSHPTSGNTIWAQALAQAQTKGMTVTDLQKVNFFIDYDSGIIHISVTESPVAVLIQKAWKTAVDVETNSLLATTKMNEEREQQKSEPTYENPFVSLGEEDFDFPEHEKPPCQMTKDEAEEEFPPLAKAIEVSGVTLRAMVDLNEVSSMTTAEAEEKARSAEAARAEKAAKKKAKKANSQRAKDEADVMALMATFGL